MQNEIRHLFVLRFAINKKLFKFKKSLNITHQTREKLEKKFEEESLRSTLTLTISQIFL